MRCFAIASGQAAPEAGEHAVPAPDEMQPFDDPKLAAFFAHWRTRLRGSAWPRRADLEPTEIPKLLPHLMITQRTLEGGERLRLVGTHIVDHLGFDPTRRDLCEMAGDGNFADLCLELLAETRRTGTVLHAGGRHLSPGGATRLCQRIVCPLSDGGHGIDATVSCVVFSASRDGAPIGDGGPAYLEFTAPVPLHVLA
ncbi:PAS domain-containing protein [Limimonas halophila]|uniref:PAS domain-containing protein n=1 Tax=Limimonas halophila TaxID=1082479 RepID=A0A1G7LT75_9PROT|nr:PAS domain-containing protein [Limimonas halophila]SDF52643.1 PAS domain-containing protein [Limimonas halophila]